MKYIKSLIFGTALVGTVLFGTSGAFAAETYTVQSGDTLSGISQKFVGDNSLVNDIAKTNNISNINLIFVGQELVINTDGTSQVAKTANHNHEQAVTETPTYTEPAQTEVQASEPTSYTGNSSSAKEWIAQKESGGSYTAQNGRYYGRYQLDSSYLNGDFSAENQERVADDYVANRYGSWEAAQSFWLANGWY